MSYYYTEAASEYTFLVDIILQNRTLTLIKKKLKMHFKKTLSDTFAPGLPLLTLRMYSMTVYLCRGYEISKYITVIKNFI